MGLGNVYGCPARRLLKEREYPRSGATGCDADGATAGGIDGLERIGLRGVRWIDATS